MALILNIETATEVCSVALANNGDIVDYLENTEGRSHAALLTMFMDEILRRNKTSPSQLSAVAVSSGPGSYTGLRIGVSAAKGLCYGANKPLIAVPTLQLMTLGFIEKTKTCLTGENTWLCPMIDARRLEVYTSFFDYNAEPQVGTSAEIITENSFESILNVRKVFFFGNGAHKCKELLKHPNATFYSNVLPSARDMAVIAEQQYQQHKFVDVAYFEPYYLKDFVATTPKNKVLS